MPCAELEPWLEAFDIGTLRAPISGEWCSWGELGPRALPRIGLVPVKPRTLAVGAALLDGKPLGGMRPDETICWCCTFIAAMTEAVECGSQAPCPMLGEPCWLGVQAPNVW